MEVSVIPEWCQTLTHITTDDVVRGGACRDGVDEWMESTQTEATLLPVAVALRIDGESGRGYITKASHLSGYGYGDGYGSGYGYGSGSGDGYGSGYGDGR